MKTPVTLVNKQPEIYLGEKTWEDLFVTAFAVQDDLIREPIDQLENIRNVSTAIDEQVILRSLHQIGLDLSPELIVPNVESIKRGFYMLGLYHERAGTKDFYKLLSWLIGRTIEVNPLYTFDYEFFYRNPLGAMITQGGNWYLSTHADVYVQAKPFDYKNIQDLEEKILEAFLEVCPTEMVVRSLVQHIDLNATMFINGCITVDNTEWITIGDIDPVFSVTIEGPTEVAPYDTHLYTVLIRHDSGKEVRHTSANWNTDTPLASISNRGICTFSPVAVNTVVTVSVKFQTFLAQVAVQIVADRGQDVMQILIDGPDYLLQGYEHQYLARVVRNNGSVEPYVPQWEYVGTEAKHDRGRVLAYRNPEREDTTMVLTAKHVNRDGSIVTQGKEISLRYIPTGVYPKKLRVAVPAAMTVLQTYVIKCYMEMSDNTDIEVDPQWETSTLLTEIDPVAKTIITGDAEGKFEVDIKVAYNHGDYIIRGEKTVEILPTNNKPVQMFVIGPTSVQADSMHQYYVRLLWTDGTSNLVKPDEWYISRYKIDEYGMVNFGSTDVNRTVNISAVLEYRGVSLAEDLDVTVLKEQRVLEHIEVIGSNTLKIGDVAQYSAIGRYSDGTYEELDTNWELPASVTYATIDNDGRLEVTGSPSTATAIVEVVTTYQVGQTSFTANKQLVFLQKVLKVKSISITGPTQITEFEDEQLYCTAVMEDNSVQSIIPKWEVLSSDEVNHPEVDADVIDIRGIIRGRPVEEASTVLVRALYFRHVALHEVKIVPKEPGPIATIAHARIIGPSVVAFGQTASYAHEVTYQHCDDPFLVSTDWSLNVPASIAEIDGDGYLISHSTQARTITITSTFTEANSPAGENIQSLVIQLAGTDVANTGLRIEGPTTVNSNSSNVYLCYVTRNGGPETLVQPNWSLPGVPAGVNITYDGQLYVSDLNVNQNITVRAVFSDGIVNVEATLLVAINTVKPIYGVGPIGVDTDQEISNFLTTNMPSSISGNNLTANISGVTDYGYFAHPVSLGRATFTDISNNFQGGWDGATWPANGTIGSSTGPLLVQRTIGGQTEDWYLYRTDFPGLGQVVFRVDYSN